jgi:steroid delta-isomerase-like uncharacterized protein
MPKAMDRTAKLALVERFMDATNTGRLDLLDECVAADYVQHNPWAGQGLSGVREYFARMLESFPDLNARLDAFITEDDLIATRFTVTGTHRGAFAGHPPTGRTFEMTTADYFRVQDGRLAEHRDVLCLHTLLDQLGLPPDPGVAV